MQAVLPSHFRMRMLPGFSRMLWRKPGEVYYIGGADVLPNPLSPQQESAVIESLTKEDSQQARASLIEHNLRLVVYIAPSIRKRRLNLQRMRPAVSKTKS